MLGGTYFFGWVYIYILTFLEFLSIFYKVRFPLDEAEATKVVKESAREARRKIEDFNCLSGVFKSWGNFYLCLLYVIALDLYVFSWN